MALTFEEKEARRRENYARLNAAHERATWEKLFDPQIEIVPQVKPPVQKSKISFWKRRRNFFQRRAFGMNGRASSLKAEGRVTPQELRDLWDRDGGQCVFCGRTDDLQFDHIVSYAAGGSNVKANLQLLCGRCNQRKGK